MEPAADGDHPLLRGTVVTRPTTAGPSAGICLEVGSGIGRHGADDRPANQDGGVLG